MVRMPVTITGYKWVLLTLLIPVLNLLFIINGLINSFNKGSFGAHANSKTVLRDLYTYLIHV